MFVGNKQNTLAKCPNDVFQTNNMELRRVLGFNGTVGLTLPRKFSTRLDLHWKDYVEIYLRDGETIIIKKHKPRSGAKIYERR